MKLILFSAVLLCQFGYSQSTDDYLNEAWDLYDQEKYDAAIKVINKGLEKDTGDYRLYNARAQLYYRSRKFQESYDDYTRALRKAPENAGIWSERGNLLISVGIYDAGISDLEYANSIATDDTTRLLTLINLAAGQSGIRNHEDAYTNLIKAYNIDSTDLAVLTNLGAVCDEVGKPEETLYFLNKAYKLDSLNIPVIVNIGFKHQAMGEHGKAITYFDRALELQPEEAVSLGNRAFSKYHLDDLDGALKDINKSIKLYSANSYSYRTRAMIYIKMNKKDKACEDLQTAIDLDFVISYGDSVIRLKQENCR